MSKLIDEYLNGLLKAYKDADVHQFKLIPPASENQINHLKSIYPKVPNELLELLKRIDGTDGVYNQERVRVPFFEDGEFPFTFCSTETMLEHANSDCSWAELYDLSQEDIEYEEIFSCEINPLASCNDWLHLGKNMVCYSNLYIDFNPSKFGKEGQIIFYLNDPDSYFSIADSFTDLLKMNINSNFEVLKERYT